jgi:hypothetical protein
VLGVAQAAFGADLQLGGPVYLDAGFVAASAGAAVFGARVDGGVVEAPIFGGGGISRPLRIVLPEQALTYVDAGFATAVASRAEFGASSIVGAGIAAQATASALVGPSTRTAIIASLAVVAAAGVSQRSDVRLTFNRARAEQEEELLLLLAA